MMADHENLIPRRSNSSSWLSYARYTDCPAAAQVVGKAAAADSSQQTRRYDDRQQVPLPAYLQRRKDGQALPVPPVYLRRVNYPTPQAIVRKAAADTSDLNRQGDGMILDRHHFRLTYNRAYNAVPPSGIPAIRLLLHGQL